MARRMKEITAATREKRGFEDYFLNATKPLGKRTIFRDAHNN